MGAFCQMAYSIGEDLFAFDNYRAVAMAEYVGKYNLIKDEAFNKGTLVGDDFVYFQLLHIIILNSCLFYFISKSTEYRFSALFFCFIYYYLYFSTEILRESLAIFVFVLNYKNYEEGNWFKYYCGVCIAILFHISAVILIVFPFVNIGL